MSTGYNSLEEAIASAKSQFVSSFVLLKNDSTGLYKWEYTYRTEDQKTGWQLVKNKE